MTLEKLRTKIDKIDEQIITLLEERIGFVKQVGELKKQNSTGSSFIRAGREASMLRNLTKKADGILPPAAVATIWRMVISASLQVEQNIKIYSADKNCFWLAREYFGTFLDIKIAEDTDRLIAKVAGDYSAVGVLPLYDDSEEPWWQRPARETNNIYVFARIPFIFEDNKLVPPALAIANTMPEPTDSDVSLLAISADIRKSILLQLLAEHNLTANVICVSYNRISSHFNKSASAASTPHYLVEVNGFITIGHEILRKISESIKKPNIVRFMGAYAVPINSSSKK